LVQLDLFLRISAAKSKLRTVPEIPEARTRSMAVIAGVHRLSERTHTSAAVGIGVRVDRRLRRRAGCCCCCCCGWHRRRRRAALHWLPMMIHCTARPSIAPPATAAISRCQLAR